MKSKTRSSMSKLLSILLALTMVLSMIPMTVFADSSELQLIEELSGYTDSVVIDDENSGDLEYSPTDIETCDHHTHDDTCIVDGVCTFECVVCVVQEMIDTLPTEVNSDEEAAALEEAIIAVDDAVVELPTEQSEQLDYTNFFAAQEALDAWYGVVIDDVALLDEEEVEATSDEVAVAKVGDIEYATIDEAIAAWANNTTLTLLADVTLSDVVTLKSTEYHILDLGTYTMTAASGKDAIKIENNARSSASYALDIKADAENPGGITAAGKAIVRTAGKSGVKDRPIIRFYGGIFNASYIVYHSGSNGTNCPQFQFHGGEFNGTIYTNRALNQFYGGTFNGSLMMSVDSSAYTLIAGGTFEQLSNLYMSALNSNKFTIGSAKGVYDKEVYIDDDGNYVIAASEPSEGIEAGVAKTPGTNDYLAYSKVATEGSLNYTDVYMALEKNKSAEVTVYVDELDLTDSSFTGTIVVPEGEEITIIVEEGTTPTWTVTDSNGNESSAVTYINSEGAVLEKADDGSFAAPEPVYVAKINGQGYENFADALTDASVITGDVTVEIYDKVTLNSSLSGSYDSITFVGKDTDAEIYLDVQGYITATGKKVAFEDLILSKSAGGFIDNAGFMNVAFGVYDVTEVTYTKCTFSNGSYASSGEVTYNGCIFKRSHDKYGLWAYGDVDVTVDGCTFADYRGIKMYAEGAAKTTDLTVKNCSFSAVTDKPAIVLTYGESVTLEGNTYSSTGVFELDLDGAPNGTAVTSDVAPTCKNDNGACGVLVDGKIYTTVAQAAEVATSGSTVTLLHHSTETVELGEGVILDKNGYTADGVTVAVPVPVPEYEEEGNDGTSANPYIINSDSDFAELIAAVNGGKSYAGKYFKLDDDINLAGTVAITENGIVSNDASTEWTPIGNGTRSGNTYTGNAFKGVFDGDYNTISGLTITGGTYDTVGLFGVVDGGTVKNVILENVNIDVTTKNAGAAIGLMVNGATAENITVSGSITAPDGVGGVVGRMTISGTIDDCVNNATVTANGGSGCAGGIVGKAYYTETGKSMTISDCTNNGAVTGGYAAGGVAGLSAANISGCSNTADITAATEAGGIVGEQTMYGTISGNTNTGKISNQGSGTAYGGIVGWARYANATTDYPLCDTIVVSNNVNKGIVSASGASLGSGGIVGTVYNQATVTENKNYADTISGGVFGAGIVGGAQNANGNIDIAESNIVVSNNYSETTIDNIVITGTCKDLFVYLNDPAFVAEGNTYPVAAIDDVKYGSLQDAINAAGEGDTVTILSDIALAEGVTVAADDVITIDLNGKTISRNTEAASSTAAITNNGNLTIIDSGVGGKITAFASNPDTAAVPYYASNTITNCGVLTVKGGTIKNSTGDEARAAFPIDNNSTSRDAIVNIEGGTITGRGAIRQFANSTTHKNEVNITGGTVTGTSYGIWVQNPGSGDPEAELNISGGTVAKVLLDPNSGFEGSITDGTISEVAIWEADTTNTDRNPSGFISGGTFTVAPAGAYLAHGYVLSPNDDGTYGVEPGVSTYVASLNGIDYTSLQDAINAVADDGSGTIYVKSDIVLDDTVTIPAGKTITLNLNGHTISQSKACTGSYEMISNKGTLTITGNGKISFTDTGVGDPAAGWGSYTIRNEGTLVVENGTIENLSTQNQQGQAFAHTSLAIFQYSGSTTINGGTISTPRYRSLRLWSGDVTINGGTFEGQVWVHCVNDTAKMTINGGEFAPRGNDGSSVFVNNTGYKAEFSVTGGTFSTKIGANDVNALAGSITGGKFTEAAANNTNSVLLTPGWVFGEVGTDGYCTIEEGDFIAEVDGEYYENLEEALKAVESGSVVNILNDITITTAWDCRNNGAKITADNVTINGNNKTLTLSGAVDDKNWNTVFRFEGDNAKVEDLTIDASLATGIQRGISSKLSITVENCTIIGNGTTAKRAIIFGEGAGDALSNVTATINKCKFINWSYGVSDNQSGKDAKTVSITDSSFNNASALVSASETVTFTGNTVTGGYVNIRSYSETNGLDVTATGNALDTSDDFADLNTIKAGGTVEAQAEFIVCVLKLSGSGTEEDPYLISSLEELIFFRNSVNAGETKYSAPGVYVALGANIDLSGQNWVAIGSAYKDHGFMGNFDGKDYKIENLTITNPAVDSDGYVYAGLFGVTEGTDKDNQNIIKNLTIENVTINTDGHIAAAAIAYPYYTVVENVKVCGKISITGGDYTAGALAYTRRCVNASNVSVEGDDDSAITGGQVVGGVISDIQMNGGLTASYSNFSVSGVTITGEMNVGGISGIISGQTLNTCSVKNVTLVCNDARVGIVSGSMGSASTISSITVENTIGATATIGGDYTNGYPVEARIGDKYYATFAAAYEAAQVGDTITLLANVTISDKITVNKNLTIDGNGNTLTYTGSDRAIDVPTEANGANVTIKNLTVVAESANRGINYNTNGTLTVENVKVTMGDNVDGYAINFPALADNATVIITDSELTARIPLNIWGENMNIDVVDTAITSVDTSTQFSYAGIQLNNEVTNVANGTTVTVTGGSITARDEEGEPSLAVSNWTATGVVNISDTTTVIGEVKNVVAMVAGVGFHDLQSAIDGVKEYNYSAPIVIIHDFDISEIVTVPSGVTITLDLNGKTITGTDNASGNFGLININPGAELTIKDEVGTGKITLSATNNRYFNKYSSVISNQRGKLTVNGGTIEHLGGTDMAYGIDNLTNGKGTYAETIINGGTVKSTYRAIRQFLNGTEAQNILTINGGTIEGVNKSVWVQDPNTNANSGTITVAAGAILKGDVYLYVTAESTEWPVTVSIAAAALDGESTVVTGNIPDQYIVKATNGVWGVSANPAYGKVAKIGDTYYATLTEAINAADDGDTIYVMPVTIDEYVAPWASDPTHASEKSITLLGASEWTEGETILTGGMYLGYDDSQNRDHDITVKGFTFKNKGILVAGQDVVTIENNKFNNITDVVATAGSASANAISVIGKDVTAIINNNEISNTTSGGINLRNTKSVTVTGNTIIDTKDNSITVQNNTSDGDVTIENNNLSTWGTGNEGRAMRVNGGKNVTINDNVMTCAAPPEQYAKVTGAATIDASQNYWDGKDPSTTDIFATDSASDVCDILQNYYTTYSNGELSDLVTFPVVELYDGEDLIGEYTTITAAIAEARKGDTVKLIRDVSEEVTVADGKTVTIELDGKTLFGCFKPFEGNLTVSNGTIDNDNGDYSAIEINAGTLTLTDVNITSVRHGVRIDGAVNATINGGEYKVDNDSGTRHAVNVSGAANVTIVDGTFVGPKGTTMDSGAAVNVQTGATVTIEGGSFSGGKNHTLSSDGILKVTGGTFDQDPTAYVADGYSSVANTDENGDTTFTVSAIHYVAQIGAVKYETLQDAINAAEKGAEIDIIANIELTEGVTVAADDEITIDLNGKTITGTPTEAAAYAVITNNGTLTIKDSGTGGAIVCDHKLAGSTAYAVNTITNVGTLKVQGGTIENKSTASSQIGYAIDNNSTSYDAVVEISGGEIKASGSGYYDAIRLFCNSETNGNSVTVSGGTVSSIWLQNPSDGSGNKDTKNVKGSVTINGGTVNALYLEPSSEFEASITGGTIGSVSYFTTSEGRDLTGFISGGTFTTKPDDAFAAPGFEFVENSDGTYGVEATNVAAVYAGNRELKRCTSLADAIAYAHAGETVKLLADVTLSEGITVDKAIIIDGNGKSVTGKTIILNSDITISGKLNVTGLYIYSGNVVIAESADVDVSNTFGIWDGGSLAVKANSELSASSIYFNGGSIDVYGTLKATPGNDGGFILNGADDVVNVYEGATLDVSYVDIYKTSGNSTVNVYGTAIVGFKMSDGSGKFTWNISDGGELSVAKNGIVFNNANSVINIAGTVTSTSVTGNGEITLTAVGAKLNATEGLTVKSNVDGYEVTSTDGVYTLSAISYVAQIGDVKYASLQEALNAAAAGTGNVTVDILADINLTNVDWNPVTVSAPGYPVVTVNGNNKTITGLNDMLFAGTWAGGSGLIINDLTIKDSTIVNDENDEKGTVGVGAFIGYPQASATITLKNCHLVNSTVKGGHWTGGLIGMAGGYNGNDGPVFMDLTITGCSVTGSTITGKGSAGGIIGHGSCAAWTNVVITDTTVSGNTITSTGSSTNKAGAVMGTIGAAGQSTTAAGETKTGGASVAATVSGNTVTSGGTTITTIYGRQGTETGMLYISGGTYDKYPIEENVAYAKPIDGHEIVMNDDGTYGVVPATYVAYIGEQGYTTLAKAVEAAQSGDTIVLKPGEYTLPEFANKELTLKGEDKDNTSINDWVNKGSQGMMGSTVHFEDLTINGNTENYYGLFHTTEVTYKNCNINGLRFLYAPNVSFEGCAFNAEGVEHSFWTYGASNVTVKNCTFTYTDRAVNCYSESGKNHETDITFTGCTFTYAGTAGAPEGAVEINSGSSKSIKLTMNNCTAPAKGAMWFNSQWDSTGGANTVVFVNDVQVWPVYVAKIGEQGYSTLAKAVEAATEGAEIDIIANIELTEGVTVAADDVITIDLNGHSVTAPPEVGLAVRVNGKLTVKGGTVDAAVDAFYVGVKDSTVGDNAELTIESDAVVKAGDCCVVIYGGTLNSAGTLSTSSNTYAAIQGSGNSAANDNTVINITVGTVTAASSVAIYQPQDGTLNISGGTVTGQTAVYVKDGALTVSGGTVKATGNKFNYEANNNGCCNTGDAIVLEADSVAYGVPTATISGGSIIAKAGSPVAAYTASGSTAFTNTDFISGDSKAEFSADVSEYCVSGHLTEKNPTTGMYEVKEDTSVPVAWIDLDDDNAQDDDEKFISVQAALYAAESGKTVKLIADATESTIMIPNGVTLDLNGKYLDTDNIFSFGDVIDTGVTTGGVVISNDPSKAFIQLQSNNNYLPLYDAKNGCYRFFEYELINRGIRDVTSDGAKFGFAITFNNSEAYDYFADTENSGVKLKVDLDWTDKDEDRIVQVVFTGENVYEYATKVKNEPDKTFALTLTVSGLEDLNIDFVSAQMMVTSDNTGFSSSISPLTHTVSASE